MGVSWEFGRPFQEKVSFSGDFAWLTCGLAREIGNESISEEYISGSSFSWAIWSLVFNPSTLRPGFPEEERPSANT